jgi:hypothetical protein
MRSEWSCLADLHPVRQLGQSHLPGPVASASIAIRTLMEVDQEACPRLQDRQYVRLTALGCETGHNDLRERNQFRLCAPWCDHVQRAHRPGIPGSSGCRLHARQYLSWAPFGLCCGPRQSSILLSKNASPTMPPMSAIISSAGCGILQIGRSTSGRSGDKV